MSVVRPRQSHAINRYVRTLCGVTLFFFLNGSSSPGRLPDFDILTIPVGKGAGSVEAADFNGDGRMDLAIANCEDSSLSMLLNISRRKFAPAPGSPLPAGHFPNDITIADFNKDGIPDLAIANHERKQINILLGEGTGHFHPAPGSPVFVNAKPHVHGVTAGDFDGDGNLDIATDSWAVDSILLLKGDGKGGFSNPRYFGTGKHPYQRIRTADLNRDGKPDIVITNLHGNDLTVLLSEGDGRFSKRDFPAGDTPFGVAVGDVNGDGNPDLAVINAPTISSGRTGTDGMTVLTGDGTGNFNILKGSPFGTGKGPTRVAVGDLNGDKIDDIVVTNYNSGSISIFYMGRNGLLSSGSIRIGEHSDGIAIKDMDGDGKDDIIVTNYEGKTVNILFTSSRNTASPVNSPRRK